MQMRIILKKAFRGNTMDHSRRPSPDKHNHHPSHGHPQSCQAGGCDDHSHFTLFSTISQMLRELCSAVVETLATPFSKDNKKRNSTLIIRRLF